MKKIILCLSLFVLCTGLGRELYPQSQAKPKEEYPLPGDVKQGWRVFNQKKCGACHSIWGEGGTGGPDLGTLPQAYISQAELAALMWNHGPDMWGRMTSRKVPFQKFDRKEMEDLFAFLYFIRYMNEPGDPQRGKSLVDRACGKCHSGSEGAKSDLRRWAMYTNPILWAQMMWNHSAQMEREAKRLGVSAIEFRGNEMVDLIAYIRGLNPGAEKVYVSPGDPKAGERLFQAKSCTQCHAAGKEIDLSKKKEFPRTLAQLAGVMWNHSHEMRRAMEKKRIPFPNLAPDEMADLVAYLFSIRYFDAAGDPERGKNVFSAKQCAACHGRGSKNDLSGLKGRISPIFMAESMWNHGPEMMERMKEAKISWHKINGKEMVDLMEYLNRGLP